jgi:AMMECR1 domain-containing protein
LIEISVLSPLREVVVGSRPELVTALRPGTDGLYLTCAHGASAFLPSVWEQLPDADEFVRHLQVKAGLPPGWWPPDMKAYRFTATKFGCRAGRVRHGSVR